MNVLYLSEFMRYFPNFQSIEFLENIHVVATLMDSVRQSEIS